MIHLKNYRAAHIGRLLSYLLFFSPRLKAFQDTDKLIRIAPCINEASAGDEPPEVGFRDDIPGFACKNLDMTVWDRSKWVFPRNPAPFFRC